MMSSFSSGWGSILYSQQSGFFFFFLFRSKVSEMSRALWENMGLQGYVCLDNRSQPRAARHKKLLVHEATTAAPSWAGSTHLWEWGPGAQTSFLHGQPPAWGLCLVLGKQGCWPLLLMDHWSYFLLFLPELNFHLRARSATAHEEFITCE